MWVAAVKQAKTQKYGTFCTRTIVSGYSVSTSFHAADLDPVPALLKNEACVVVYKYIGAC